jgi:hypothetical protein
MGAARFSAALPTAAPPRRLNSANPFQLCQPRHAAASLAQPLCQKFSVPPGPETRAAYFPFVFKAFPPSAPLAFSKLREDLLEPKTSTKH